MSRVWGSVDKELLGGDIKDRGILAERQAKDLDIKGGRWRLGQLSWWRVLFKLSRMLCWDWPEEQAKDRRAREWRPSH